MIKSLVVMIVDDEPLLREILREEFERAGYAVLEAEGGRAALAIIARQRPDVIVSDFRMPGGNGLELLGAVIKMGKDHPPVFFVSGFSDMERDGAIAGGAAGFFEKPYRIQDLLNAVAGCCENAA